MTLLQVNSIELVGGGRSIGFGPGVNVVVGPIATGKSTLVKLLRALFAGIPSMPVEVNENVTSLRASVTFGDDEVRLMRRLVTTETALIEVVDGDEALLLPATRSTATREVTYASWLLRKLDLPEIAVPAAPTRPESDPTSVSAADYLNYSFLRGDEIDNCVFGHTNAFRDIKRKYVFEIVYGLYDEIVAGLQAELRAIENELSYLRGEQAATGRIFEGTELESIESVRVARESREARLTVLREHEAEQAAAVAQRLGTTELRQRVDIASSEIVAARSRIETSKAQLLDLRALDQQLRSQQARIVRALIAEEVMVDFEFVICPRCGLDLDDDRGHGVCRLCLQPEPAHAHVEALQAERERLEEQLTETVGLLESRTADLGAQEAALEGALRARNQLARELDHATQAFVSDRQQAIEATAAEKATLEAEVQKYRAYLVILERGEASGSRIADLTTRRGRIRAQLEEVTAKLRAGQENVDALNARFEEYVRRLEVPSFGAPLTASVDLQTYLPIVAGRRFESLSSQGLQVLVNVAHALAHHTVAIDRGLRLPGLLVLDGPSSNVGTEGFDAQRLIDVYDLLADISADYGDRLQIIVVDNNIPDRGQEWVRLRLAEDNRLIHASSVVASLNGGDEASKPPDG